MKTEKKLLWVSLNEMILASLVGLFLLNGLFLIISTFFLEISFKELFEKTWLLLVIVPLFQGIIQPFTNLNERLTIENNEESEINRGKVEEFLNRLNYTKMNKNDNLTIFNYNSKVMRMINLLYRGKVIVLHDYDSTRIYGKRIIINQIKSKI